MRAVFGEALCELAEEFPRMVVLDADVSTSTQTRLFAERHADRVYNFGIAEANMVSAAAGMAASGLIPVASSFAFLLSLRAGDAVRSHVAYPRLNVKLAGGYAGLSDHADGASHQSVADVAVMRALPNMTVLVPSDIETTRGAVRAMLEFDGPVYLRLSRQPVGSLHGGDKSFAIGATLPMRQGRDVTIAVCGTLLGQALAAAEALHRDGTSAAVVEFPTVKPLDGETLARFAAHTGAVVTVEEHSVLGGFGGAVSECLARRCPVPVRMVGIADTFAESGPHAALLEKYGLTAEHVAAAARDVVSHKAALKAGKDPRTRKDQ
jgi:transketolase